MDGLSEPGGQIQRSTFSSRMFQSTPEVLVVQQNFARISVRDDPHVSSQGYSIACTQPPYHQFRFKSIILSLTDRNAVELLKVITM